MATILYVYIGKQWLADSSHVTSCQSGLDSAKNSQSGNQAVPLANKIQASPSVLEDCMGTQYTKTVPKVIVYVIITRKVMLEVLEFSKSNEFLTKWPIWASLTAILVNIFFVSRLNVFSLEIWEVPHKIAQFRR